MSGGGSNGAWEVGVLWGLTHYGDVEQYNYDVVTGVSIGSINSALLALWQIGNERNATEWLSETWNNLRTGDVYEHWLKDSFFGGEIIGEISGLWRQGFYNNESGM